VLVVTCLVVGGLCAWFAVNNSGDADEIATLISALAAVAGIGIAVWAAIPGSAAPWTASAIETGKAVAHRRSRAITGIAGVHANPAGMTAKRTGDARATDSADAISGVQLGDKIADDQATRLPRSRDQ